MVSAKEVSYRHTCLMFFNVFIYDLSQVLRNTFYGCYVNDQCFNHVMYADNTLLLAPSPTALQILIDICLQYFTSHRLVINYEKSKCMAIYPKSLKDLYFPKLFTSSPFLKNGGRYCFGVRRRIRRLCRPRRLRGCFALYLGCY